MTGPPSLRGGTDDLKVKFRVPKRHCVANPVAKVLSFKWLDLLQRDSARFAALAMTVTPQKNRGSADG
jgi:hypothetical protein